MDLTSGYPFWPVANGLIRTYPRLDTDLRCDVAVIGGGITGALVAHHLVDAGFDTVVLDKREIGWGSTGASTALLQYEIDVTLADLSKLIGPDRAGRAYLACREAVDTLAGLAARLPEDVGFARKKSLYLASRNRDCKPLHAELEMRRAIGLDVEWLDEAAIAARFSFSRPAGLLTPDAAQMDAYRFTHALLHDAAARGLRVFDRTNITDIDTSKSDVHLQTGDGPVVKARNVVFATGYETHEFLGEKMARLISTYAVVSEPLASFDGWGEDACVIWEHAHPYLYLRTTEDGRVIVGGEDDAFRNPERRDRRLPKKAERLTKRFREMFPQIDFRVEFAWAGTFGETRDGLAYIGEHPDWPHAWFALGYGGNGITYSVIAAEIVRDGLLGRVHRNADLFRFDR